MTCTIMRQNGELPKPPRKPWKKARIHIDAYLFNRQDMDNLFARFKWAVDWLVREGYIRDDRPACLEWAGLPSQSIDRKNQRLEITLEKR